MLKISTKIIAGFEQPNVNTYKRKESAFAASIQSVRKSPFH